MSDEATGPVLIKLKYGDKIRQMSKNARHDV